ncbi:DNA double-strand break repair protein mre11 [Desulfurococcus amylolyticus 1221n]|uniref:DNA double-strand break repair protein mre11 n=1 Tax=Desulfurococcus amylolyticus (strain DSM 18924 / JCM 16383 / VKM B-2413 / 1221n) TaxID=490899 RepID=B8D4A6_DESA1|nr:DUF87 domain-containing protein [Desulfurococcus amylolyticus]ACL10937.1 DNA double-strand break repair protein mre11 [Desulfurococcus amylolyticus 1221n]
MPVQIGFIYELEGNTIRVALTSQDYNPGLGDLLYVKEGDRTIILQTVSYEGRIPITPASIRAPSQNVLTDISKEMGVLASLFLEISSINNKPTLLKPRRPPRLMQPVFLLDPSDTEALEILKTLSELTSEKKDDTSTIAYLRAGTTWYGGSKYVREAGFKVSLKNMLRKHVIIIGQTGSGKTSGLKGLLIRYALESQEKVGWLIIDRHGEYTEGYSSGKGFIWYMNTALRNNKWLSNVEIKAIRLTTSIDANKDKSYHHETFSLVESPLNASSIELKEFMALLERRMGIEMTGMLEEFADIVSNIFYELGKSGDEIARKISSVFISTDNEPNGNLIALIPLLYANMVVYEREAQGKDRKGLFKMLIDRGIYTHHIRIIRRNILNIMGWKIRREKITDTSTMSKKSIYIDVIDDSNSIVKVNQLLKDPVSLAVVLVKFLGKLSELGEPGDFNYPWKSIVSIHGVKSDSVGEPGVVFTSEPGINIDEIINTIENGNTVILDVSQLSNEQADLIALTISRKIFENRLMAGVEESARKPVVAIVSEEAPLYLSPDRVENPFNPFARIAREGRKFNVGLIAITQLASMIEKQILGNFNTLIVLRTKSRSDIELLKDIGVPSETLPFLNDREGYLYTPDLPIKEPLPVYIPAWFEHEDDIRRIEEKPGEPDKGKSSKEDLKSILL